MNSPEFGTFTIQVHPTFPDARITDLLFPMIKARRAANKAEMVELHGEVHTWPASLRDDFVEADAAIQIKALESFANCIGRLSKCIYFGHPCNTTLFMSGREGETLLDWVMRDGDGNPLMNGGLLFRDGEVTMHT